MFFNQKRFLFSLKKYLFCQNIHRGPQYTAPALKYKRLGITFCNLFYR